MANKLACTTPIIVALDYARQDEVITFVQKIDPTMCRLKVGKELFVSCGPQLVTQLQNYGFEIFLDLKFHDIPHTVYKACKAAADLGVWMLNVHASGGDEMLSAARQGVNEAHSQAKLIAVTLLTSLSTAQLPAIGINDSLNAQVLRLATLSYKHKLDGVVCSAQEATAIKQATANSFLTVTPGIRLTANKTDDQTRIVTPVDALAFGADYLVIGRPITQATDPLQVLTHILTSLKKKD